MAMANGARMYSILGATLVAFVLPQSAVAGSGSASDVTGITTGDVTGITTGDVTGITTGDVTGITTGDVTGITTGDLTGITTGDVTGITTGDVTGITTGDVTGITTGDVTGITTGDVTGITTGDVTGITTGDLMLAGPVDSISMVNGSFVSMGQVVLASQDALSSLNVGDFVSVHGSAVASGILYADVISVSTQSYVPGATQVFVRGILSAVDQSKGVAHIGDLTVDYSSSLAGSDAPSGAMWSFKGIRPASKGPMISDRSLR